MTKQTKTCQNCKSDFTIEPEDFSFYEKIKVPAPTFCPECRLIRRLAFRNERTLYKRKCDLCGEDMIAMYRQDGFIRTYCSPCWWSDKWDPLEYGREYDFNKPFFEQFRELMRSVPHQNLIGSYTTLVNSNYNNMNHALKNCYWLFNSDYDDDCSYGEEVEYSKNCVDVTMIDHSEFIFQSVNCNKCYRTFQSIDCESSHEIWFSKNLINCNNCFGCVNLRNQQYHIFNKPYSKEEYFKKLEEFNLGSHQSVSEFINQSQEFKLKFPCKYIHGRQNVNVTGDYIYNSKNVKNTYIATESENCKYCMWLIVKPNKDCYDYTQFGENTQNIYEAMTCGKGASDVLGGISVLESHSAQYSTYCYSGSSRLFGSIGLRHKQYCILNKQYTKEEYEALVPKIIAHMNDMPYIDKQGREYRYGEFFPAELSPFAYNETTAQEFFPLTKQQAIDKGYQWKEPEQKNYNITLTTDQLPDHIKDVNESITKEIIECQHQGKCDDNCSTAFKIIPQELQFYQKMNLPLPRLCPNCRHSERIKQRNPLKLHPRKCQCAGTHSDNKVYQNTATHNHHQKDHCPNEFETTYSPERPEIVYCEKCYQEEVA